jgi:hypothetical protein
VNAANEQFNHQAAEQILYNQATGEVTIVGPQEMTLTPKPKK